MRVLDTYALIEIRNENPKFAHLLNKPFIITDPTIAELYLVLMKEVGEVCDGVDLSGETCSSQGFDEGSLTCLSDCSGFDISQCVDLPSACSDGIDNDFDNLTDYPNDPGCDSATDEDETDYTGPVELLFDSFEDGIEYFLASEYIKTLCC